MMRKPLVRSLGIGTTCLAALITLALGTDAALSAQSQPPGSEQRTFGASYESLSAEQRALVDGLFQHAGTILGVKLDPRERYDSAPLSSRTTFDAVSHALLHSTLTDRESQQPLGRTIDLIDHVDSVQGQVAGAASDQQFRLYVTLKASARQTLDRAAEFRRTADNSFFHQGYPLSYRQDGFPSVQISMSRDSTRADIDVDYRSSRFPIALVNGHLGASNSDVRAGNVDRHNGHWSGLVNWWDGLFQSLFASGVEIPPDAPRVFPTVPRAGDKTIDVAVNDFLTSWLVEGQANLAIAYADPAAYDCLASRLQAEGLTLDRGLAPLQLYVRMKSLSNVIGPRQSLADATTGVTLTDRSLKIVRHQHPELYAIYAVPRAMADKMSCASGMAFGQLPAAPVMRQGHDPYDTFYSTVRIRTREYAPAALGLLWQRREGLWRVVSYQLAWYDDNGTRPIPDLRKPTQPPRSRAMTADAALIDATSQFFDAWLIRKDVDAALAFVSPKAYECVNLYLEPGEAPKATAAEQLARIKSGLERLSAVAGARKRLEEITQRVEPTDSQLLTVDHARSKAYSLVGAPEWMGPTMSCEARTLRGDTASTGSGADQGYEKYFVVALRFDDPSGEGPVLALAWERDERGWRIYSFKIIDS